MVIPPFFDDPEQVRPYFRRLRELAHEIDSKNIPNVSMQELSMGMSHDFEVAIEEGATLIRVGTAIFRSETAQVPSHLRLDNAPLPLGRGWPAKAAFISRSRPG